jgi:hypothetical protein
MAAASRKKQQGNFMEPPSLTGSEPIARDNTTLYLPAQYNRKGLFGY